MFSFDPHECALDACYIRFRAYTMELCPFSSALTRMPPGSPLLTASVGHAVQTDQRSHDKERANTGAHSAARTNSVHVGTKKHREKDGKKGNKEEFWPQCVSRQTKRQESFVKVFS